MTPASKTDKHISTRLKAIATQVHRLSSGQIRQYVGATDIEALLVMEQALREMALRYEQEK